MRKHIERKRMMKESYYKLLKQEALGNRFDILPQQVKTTQYLHFRFYVNYFLLLWKIPEELAEDQCSSITKVSIYHIKHMYIQLFTTVVD